MTIGIRQPLKRRTHRAVIFQDEGDRACVMHGAIAGRDLCNVTRILG
jgi:hypothetical protein